MKKTHVERLQCVLFCAFLLGILLLFLILPAKDYSENEKRTLSSFPALTADNILSGDFGDQLESYLADHLPGRSFFIGLYARAEQLAGLQSRKEIYTGADHRLFERPQKADAAVIQKNMTAVNSFAGAIAQPVDLMIVPSAGWVLSDEVSLRGDPYIDGEIIGSIEALAGENVQPVALAEVFAALPQTEREALYYRTDHHWTSTGAHLAASFYLQQKGRTALPAEAYSVRTVEGFFGSTYSRACFWDYPAELLELWDSGGSFTVTLSDRDGTHDGLFYEERLSGADKYPVFLDGNHPMVTIENADPAAEGSLLVIRDSFGSSMGCFLADAYKSVTLLDLRYYKKDVAQLVRDHAYDDVLVLYSLGNFMTDSNIVWLG